MSASYPCYEVTKSFNDADGKHRIGEIIVAVTNDQEQQLTDLEREGYVRFCRLVKTRSSTTTRRSIERITQ